MNPQNDFQLLNFLFSALREPANMFVNGYPRIDQLNEGAAVTLGAAAVRPVDNWYAVTPTGVNHTAQQSTDAPTKYGFTHSLLITIGTGAAPAAGAANLLGTAIESTTLLPRTLFGTDRAIPLGIAFLVKASIAGAYSAYALGPGGLRFVTTFLVEEADTWEFKTIYIPPETTGSWSDMDLYFDLGSGTTYEAAPANEWTTTVGTRVAGTVKLVETTGATFQITGLQGRAGYVDQNFPFETYQEQLNRCRRYHPAWPDTESFPGYAQTSTIARITVPFLTESRTAIGGVIVPANLGTLRTAGGNINVTGLSVHLAGSTSTVLSVTVAAGLTAGQGVIWRTDSRLVFTGAELI